MTTTDTDVTLPPQGFYFITKHTMDDNIPMIYFALQEDGSGNTVSIRVNPQEIEMNAPTLNSLQKLLVEMWQKEYSDAPDTSGIGKYIVPETKKHGVAGEIL